VVATVVAKTAAVVSITATTAVRVAAAGRVLKGIVARNYLETAAAGHQAAVAATQPQVLLEAARMVAQVETVLTFPLFWVRHLVRLSWLAVAEAVVRLLRVLTAQVVWVVRAVVATVLETQTLPTPLRSALAEVGQVTMATTLFILAATVLTVSHT
jgi:hypothetical protein